MAIEKLDLIKNPETAPFSKLKYLKRLPEDEVTEFFNRLFNLNVEARDAGDWTIVDRFLEEQGDEIAARVAIPMGFDDTPWSPFKKRLSESKVAVLSTGGIYVEGQQPFDTDGDWSFREIPLDTPLDQLRVAHTHYDTTGVAEDVDAVLAMHRLLELEAEGIVGEAQTPTYSFMGYIPDPSGLMEVTGPEVADRLKEDGVDGVVIGTT
ncbi:MAG: glycine/sarcosine/betaine reductase selenoprotein B family protein [Dehalococcoidia bacterium]